MLQLLGEQALLAKARELCGHPALRCVCLSAVALFWYEFIDEHSLGQEWVFQRLMNLDASCRVSDKHPLQQILEE